MNNVAKSNATKDQYKGFPFLSKNRKKKNAISLEYAFHFPND